MKNSSEFEGVEHRKDWFRQCFRMRKRGDRQPWIGTVAPSPFLHSRQRLLVSWAQAFACARCANRSLVRDFEAMDPERMEEEFEEHIPLRNLRARSGILTGSRFGKDSASCAFRDDEFARAGSRAQTGARLGASGERSRRKPTNRY